MKQKSFVTYFLIFMAVVHDSVQQQTSTTYYIGDPSCAFNGTTVLSQVFESTSVTRKGTMNEMNIKVFHRLVDSFVRVTKNINDIKEFSIAGEPHLIILQVSKVSVNRESSENDFQKDYEGKNDVRSNYAVLPLRGPEYHWDLKPRGSEAYEVILNIYSCHF